MAQVKVLLLGGLARLAFFQLFPSLCASLESRVECCTPVTCYKRLLEGVFLFQRGLSPYKGGIFHESPLLLSVFAYLQPYGSRWPILVDCFYILMDVLIAYLIHEIVSNLHQQPHSKNYGRLQSPQTAAILYLFNPFIFISLLSHSTIIFSNLFVVAAIYLVLVNRPFQGIFSLAMATSLSFNSLYLLPSLITLVSAHNSQARDTPTMSKLLDGFLVSCALVLIAGYFIAGSWDYIPATHGVNLLFGDLTPNIGLWWYFFTEMFDFFRPFFLGVFQIFLASLAAPFAIRLQSMPFFALTTMIGCNAVFKSYPQVGDIGLYFSLLLIHRKIVSLMSYSAIIVIALLYPSVLGPTFYHLWIVLGSGNANFFYAMNLVHALAMSLLIADSTWSALRYEFDEGKNSKVTQK